MKKSLRIDDLVRIAGPVACALFGAGAVSAATPVWHLPGGVEISPHAYLRVASGFSSAEGEDLESLAVGAHDPTEESFNLQGLEVGASLRASEFVQGFVVANVFLDDEDEFDYEVEEAFMKLVELPLGLELRGGRYLNRFGLRNTEHLHGWDFIDQSLAHGRFLGDEGMVTEGGELAIHLPTANPTVLSLSYGSALSHDHGHGHDDEEHHDEEEGHDEDEHEGEHDEDEHLEAEAALFAEDFFTADLVKEYAYNDFHRFRGSASFGIGDNEFGEETLLYGVGLQYEWREMGYEPGGRALRWRTEVFLRDIGIGEGGHDDHEDDDHGDEEHHDGEEGEHHDEEEEHDEEEHSEHGDLDELGVSSSLVLTASERLDLGLRLGYVEGIKELGLDERLRLSPAVTFRPFSDPTAHVRLQYNYDNFSGDRDDEHSVWLQVGLSWGGNEIR